MVESDYLIKARGSRDDVHSRLSANGFCVGTVSHASRNPGQTPSFTGTRRCISLLREVVDGECAGACRCASARAAGIVFQACPFLRLRSRLTSARAAARCLAVAAPPRRRTTTRTSLRFRINNLRVVQGGLSHTPAPLPAPLPASTSITFRCSDLKGTEGGASDRRRSRQCHGSNMTRRGQSSNARTNGPRGGLLHRF
jgi:hypothetical protein